MKSNKRKPQMGFKQALEYILDELCYSYYVKADNLVSDHTFDEIERLYCVLTGNDTAPNRGNEGGRLPYSNGVQVVYDILKKERPKAKIKLLVDERKK